MATYSELFQQLRTENTGFIFTHTDLLPRNVLVSHSPSRIGGIVDFEFAGFFPSKEQFAHEWAAEHDEFDWPEDTYEMILTELETLGNVTPRQTSESDKTQVRLLYKLRKRIAPWVVGPGAETGDVGAGEDANRVRMAREEIMNAVDELERLSLT